jgi:hypothetical protein
MSGGVFTAFPDKMHRHWKMAVVGAIGVGVLIFAMVPQGGDEVRPLPSLPSPRGSSAP